MTVLNASVQAGDARLNYSVCGQGAPLLLLHGFVASSFSWRRLVPELGRKYRVYALDAWASGSSDRCTEADATLRGHAARTLAFMRELEIERCTVIATSYGGAVALQTAAMEPQRFERLVLAAPAHPFAEKPKLIAGLYRTRVGRLIARLFPVIPHSWFRASMKRSLGNQAACTRELAAAYHLPLRVPGTVDCLLKTLASFSMDMDGLGAELAKIGDIPVRLIWGERDPVVPVGSAAELMEHLQNVSLQIMPEVGHLPYEEAPEAFERAVWEGLTDTRGPPM